MKATVHWTWHTSTSRQLSTLWTRCPRHLTGSDSGASWQHRNTDPYWEETVWQIWNDIRGETRLCLCLCIVLHRHWLDPKPHAHKARNPHWQLSVLRSCICRWYSILRSVRLRCSWLPVKLQWIIIGSRYACVMAQDQVAEPGFQLGTNHPVSLCSTEIQLNPWIMSSISVPCSHLMDTADQTWNGVLASRHQSCPPFRQYKPINVCHYQQSTRLSNARLISPTVGLCIRDMDCTCHRH